MLMMIDAGLLPDWRSHGRHTPLRLPPVYILAECLSPSLFEMVLARRYHAYESCR